MNAGTWIDTFANEIEESEIPHQWILSVDKNLDAMNDGNYFSQKTFGSFNCSGCRHSWNSSKVFILFDMKLYKYHQHGNVTMRIFRQECQICRIMKEPKIPSENIERVISNIVNYIQREFYGNKKVNSFRPPCSFGKQEGPHDEEHCEACQNNLCERQRMLSQKSSMSSQESSKSSQGSSQSRVLPALAVGVGVGVGVLALIAMSMNKTKESRRGAP